MPILSDSALRRYEVNYNVMGIESKLRGCVYFTDAERTGLVIMRPEGTVGIKKNEIKDFLKDMAEIAETWF